VPEPAARASARRWESKQVNPEREAESAAPELERKIAKETSPSLAHVRARAVRGTMRARVEPRLARETLSDELSLLQAAQLALVGKPARALSLALQHQEQFPAGLFSEEREAIGIEALLRLRRYDEAERQLTLFKARYPHSTYRERLGRLQASRRDAVE
jgi:hypothetical protein